MPLKLVQRGEIYHIRGTIGRRRIRESLGTRDKEIAARKLAAFEARYYRAEVYGAESVNTFADAALKYLEAGKDGRYLAPIIKEIGRKRLIDIKPGHIREMAAKLKPHAKASTRNRHVIVPARSVINFAAELGMCPHMRVKGFKEAKVEKTAIDRTWLDAFRAHAEHHGLATLALFTFTTGARIGEAVALTPDHLDLDRKLARIEKTKTGQPRDFHLTDELVREMRLLQPRRVKGGQIRLFGYTSANALIWAWRETCKRAGIPYVSRHEAGRHSAATEAVVRRGVDVVTAAKLLGWDDPKILLRRYAHAEKLPDVAEAVFGTPVSQSVRRLKIVRK